MNFVRKTILTAMTVLVAAGGLTPAMAQFGRDRIQRPLDRPTVSPYINMFRGNNSSNVLLNYYGSVRPQQQFYSQDQRLSQRIDQNRRYFGAARQQNNFRQNNSPFRRYQMSITGHPAGFMTFGGAGGQGDEGGGDQGAGGFGGQGGQGGQNFGQAGSGHSVSFGSGNQGVGQTGGYQGF